MFLLDLKVNYDIHICENYSTMIQRTTLLIMNETPLCLSRRLIIWWLVVREQIDTSVFPYFMNQKIANMINLCMSRHSVVVVWNFCLCTRHYTKCTRYMCLMYKGVQRYLCWRICNPFKIISILKGWGTFPHTHSLITHSSHSILLLHTCSLDDLLH